MPDAYKPGADPAGLAETDRPRGLLPVTAFRGPHQRTFVLLAQALFLYLSTLYRPYDNWLTRINIANNSWAIKYLYSLYWACTTIVTVGFGDITPTNECEVFVTIFVELSGSAVFGYLINIIGMTMS